MMMEVEPQSESTPSIPNALPKDRRLEALGNLRVLPDETLCAILACLSPRDVGRVACVSSVMYIFCNEEPLWMSLCLQNVKRLLQYKGSWKKTTLHQLDLLSTEELWSPKPLQFEGFYSLFLYRRLYRCYTTLDGFSFDEGSVERRNNLSFEEFDKDFDSQKPVLILCLSDTWPARKTWTPEKLVKDYGDKIFQLSQRGPRKITMRFSDYTSYIQMQHDEDPLYVFDDEFGEVAPSLLEEYSVPHLFQEDFFDVLSRDERPPFRWLIIGPERSGASWHVDPALTSAWNTLLCGRKRWALYPPGKVPIGVTVHVNEDDGEVHIDTPTSLQWWLDFYPLLSDEDKPIECTQLPGETIYVPTGWWHCVLNLETTVAVTQNFVNSKNFEFVCLDMAPGYKHKGVCRAGLLALEKEDFPKAGKHELKTENGASHVDLERKDKRARICQPTETSNPLMTGNDDPGSNNVINLEFSYNIDFLSTFLDKERDHFISLWSSSNFIEQRKMREWLVKLWGRKPGLRDLIWKGACLALNACGWFECLGEICRFHNLPLPTDEEKLPAGSGSNPVYLVGDNVIKIFAEGGPEASLYALGTELEFYNLLRKVNSQLKDHIPRVLGSGILFIENGSHKVLPWDGEGVPNEICSCGMIPENHSKAKYPFGIWNKMILESQKLGLKPLDSISHKGVSLFPYVVTERCRGKMFAELRETLSLEDTSHLASFLGEKLRFLHLLPCPSYNESGIAVNELKSEISLGNGFPKVGSHAEHLFINILNNRKEDIRSRLIKWGDPIPSGLIDRVVKYLPEDFGMFFPANEDDMNVSRSCSWIHNDVMDDNIQLEPCHVGSSSKNTYDSRVESEQIINDSEDCGQTSSWRPCHLIDFSNLSLGHPICDIIPLHLDVFRGDSRLMQQFLEAYKLPFVPKESRTDKFGRASYLAMCLCILHEDNVLGAIFGLWKELKMASSWEEVEEKVWGDLNNYKGYSL